MFSTAGVLSVALPWFLDLFADEHIFGVHCRRFFHAFGRGSRLVHTYPPPRMYLENPG